MLSPLRNRSIWNHFNANQKLNLINHQPIHGIEERSGSFFSESYYLSGESVDGIGAVVDHSLATISVDEGVAALDDAGRITGLSSGEGVVLVLLVELELVGGGGFFLGWRRKDDGHEEGSDGEDLRELRGEGS
ncbi:hypothetical protein TYRP_013035 [Tyrophagus putrescentiae]|nr:hypothetical protein TYRP_013035 [Tyrophagus putrescentiae]